MNIGDTVTVVHGGRLVVAIALKLKECWWYTGGGYSGPLGDEDIHYVRDTLFTWWPPHKKRRAALLVAAALGDPPPLPIDVRNSKVVAQTVMNTIQKSLEGDYRKLLGDAERALGGNITKRTFRLTKRTFLFQKR